MRKKRKKQGLRASECIDCAALFLRSEWRMLLPFFIFFHTLPVMLMSMLTTQDAALSLIIDAAETETFDVLSFFLYAFGMMSTLFFYLASRYIVTGACIYSAQRRTQLCVRPPFREKLKAGLRLMVNSWLINLIVSFVFGFVSALLTLMFSFIVSFFTVSELMSRLPEWLLVVSVAVFYLAILTGFLYLTLRFTYFSQFVVIRRENAFRALGDSWRATRGRVRHMLALSVISLLAIGEMNAVTVLLVQLGLATSQFVTQLISALFAAFSSLALYLDELARTFSFMREVPADNALASEMMIRNYLRSQGV